MLGINAVVPIYKRRFAALGDTDSRGKRASLLHLFSSYKLPKRHSANSLKIIISEQTG
jgi:hypothetical protein